MIELNKENAPNILLEQFNYFANKAINNYINKRYNIYDISQQTTDDLRVLKSNATLLPKKVNDYIGLTMAGSDAMATYEVIMPSDYLHILNCICVYKVNKTYKCYNKGDYWRAPATRLTADMYSQVLDNFWNKPTYKKPYYYIHNVNTVNDLYNYIDGEIDSKNPINYATTPTNPYTIFENIEDSQETDNTNIESLRSQITTLLNNINTTKRNFNIEDYNVSFSLDQYFVKVVVINTEDNSKYGYFIKTGNLLSNCNYCYKYETINSIDDITEPSPEQLNYTCSEETPIVDYAEDASNILGAVYNIQEAEEKIKVLRLELENEELKLLLNNATSKKGRFKGTDSSRELDFIGEDLDGKLNDYGYGQDGNGISIAQGTGLPKYVKIGDAYVSNVERGLALRYGNTSEVRLEIRYGTDNSVFLLIKVYVDYIKAPQNIRLTQREIDLTEDTSQMLEYPDYVCQEIVNELVHLIMENISDGRLQTHPVVTLSIANPAQQLATAQEA